MSDGAYYTSKEYLLKKYSSMSQQERDDKREDFDRLRRFHALADSRTVAQYKRLLGILDEAEKETSSPSA